MVQIGGGGKVQALMSLFGGGGKSTAKLKPSKASEALASGLKSGGVSPRKPSPGTDQNRLNMSNTAYRTSGSVPMSSMATSKASKLMTQSHTQQSTSSAAHTSSKSSSSSSFAANRSDLPLGDGGPSSSGGGSGSSPFTGLTNRLSSFAPGAGQDGASSSSGSSSSSSVDSRSSGGSGGGGVTQPDYGSNVRNLKGMFESGAANNATGAASGGGAADAAGVIRDGAVASGQSSVSGIFDTSSSSSGVQGGRSGSGGGDDSSGLSGGISNSPREAARQTSGVSVSEHVGIFGGIGGDSSAVDGASGSDRSGSPASASMEGSSVDPVSSSEGSSVDPESFGEGSNVDGPGSGGKQPSSPGAYAARLATRNVDVAGAVNDIENRTEQPVDSPGRRDAEEATKGVSVSSLREKFLNPSPNVEPVPVAALIEKARMHEAAISSPLAEPQTASIVDSSTSTDGDDDGPILSSDNFVDRFFFDETAGSDSASGVDASASTSGFDEVDSASRNSSTSTSNTTPYADGPYGPGTSDISGLSRDGLRMLANDILNTVESGGSVDGINFEEQAGGHKSTTGGIDGTNLAVQTELDGVEAEAYAVLNELGQWLENSESSEEDAPQPLRDADSTALRGLLNNRGMTASVLPIPLAQQGNTVIIENPEPGPKAKIPFRVVFGNTDINKDFGPTSSSNRGPGDPGEGEGGKVPSKGFRKFLQRFALPMGNAGAGGAVAGGGGGNTAVIPGGRGGIMYTNNLDSVGGNSTAIITGGGGGGLNSLLFANGTGGNGPLFMFTNGLTNLNREQLVHLHGQLGALMDTVEVLPPNVLNSEVQITMPTEGSIDTMPRVILADVGGGGIDTGSMNAEDIRSLRTDMVSGLQELSNQVTVALSGGGNLDSISLSGGGPAARGEASA